MQTQVRPARGVQVIKFKFIVRSRHTKHSTKKRLQKNLIFFITGYSKPRQSAKFKGMCPQNQRHRGTIFNQAEFASLPFSAKSNQNHSARDGDCWPLFYSPTLLGFQLLSAQGSEDFKDATHWFRLQLRWNSNRVD